MNNEQQSLAVSGTSALICGILGAVQPDDVLRYVNLSLAILSTLVALAFTFWKWWHEATKDKKITPDEVGDLLDKVNGVVQDTKDSIGKIADEDKKEKENERDENSSKS